MYICIAWRRGLRRVWDLHVSPGTHSALIAPLCGLLQLKVELAYRCAMVSLRSVRAGQNHTVRSIATQRVNSQRMRSPIGRNAQYYAAFWDVSTCIHYQKNRLDKSWGTAVQHWLWYAQSNFRTVVCSTSLHESKHVLVWPALLIWLRQCVSLQLGFICDFIVMFFSFLVYSWTRLILNK